MQACVQRVVIEKPGPYDRLKLIEAPDPIPQPTELVVRTEAVGVNYADCVVRRGLYSSAKKYVGWPITPGFEFAGKVLKVGASVQAFRAGDRVFGVTRFGGYATHLCVEPWQVTQLPEGWTMPRAAAFPTVSLTAWYALCELCRPRRGMWVLVHSAAGGVGTAALGLGRHLGLNMVGIVGAANKVNVAVGAGASHVIDRSNCNWEAELKRLVPEGVHVVLESSGASTLRASYRSLRPTGRLVIFGMSSLLPRGTKRLNWPLLAWRFLSLPRFHPLDLLDTNRSVSGFNLSYLFDQRELLQEGLRQLLAAAAEGALAEPPIRCFPLASAGEAQRELETGTTVGKLVLITRE